ncbi:hypothetical protein FLM48_01830 [Shewanella sp. Scap07]|uniref:hypothetical protein n=1 Tax=Shewanella sp. Scap07 TaxID=2589987 RepID=UPI0015C1470C|nr:hypothetical protein [Shewanella sp. Scap07]QLE83938.1 hypothetical protein FLM48_01830 [Shewanella sp. Scap07]
MIKLFEEHPICVAPRSLSIANQPSLAEVAPQPFDVIAAWHPRYNDDALQKWMVLNLRALYVKAA